MPDHPHHSRSSPPTRVRRFRTRATLWCAAVVAAALVPLQAMTGIASAATPQPTTTVGATIPEVVNGAAVKLGPYDANAPLRLVVGLRVPHPAEEQTFLDSLQDKSSPQFHKFLTQSEFTARFGPSAQSEQAVVDWLGHSGLTVTHRYPNRLIVDVIGTAGTIAKALHVSMNNYRLGGVTFFANDRNPTLPSSLTDIVESIGGLNSYQKMQPASGAAVPDMPAYAAGPVAAKGPAAHSNGSMTALRAAMKASEAKLAAKGKATNNSGSPNITGGSYDPTDIYSSQGYDFAALQAQGHCCNPYGNAGSSPYQTSIAIASLGSQAVSDMQGFQARYSYLAYNFNEVYVGGTPSCCDGEGTMDLEWATAMANSFGSYADTAHVWMYDGATNYQSTFTTIYNQMVSDNNARVMSTSWGCEERSGGSFTCDSGTLNTQHNIFANMVGLGWTIVAASGDHGAYGNCVNLGVMFPASDPNVIAAGGTELSLSAGPIYNSETGWSGNPNGCASNGGGSTGGCSVYFAAPSYQGSAYPCGSGSRSVPDIALNADWYNTPQNLYFNGGWGGNGGTSIVAPEISGFLAQENSYLYFMGSICGLGNGHNPCAPMGAGNPLLYRAMNGSAPHNPTYDITSGCSSNNIGTGWCAAAGYDLVTGFGSANMLQLAWAINYWTVAENTAPTVNFVGPTPGQWYNTDQTVYWSVVDGGGPYPASGSAGYTKGWDSALTDPTSHATPGSGDSFYAGPQFPGSTGGFLNVSSAGQGCHTAHVRAWDNIGRSGGDITYGPVCYDTIAPTVTAPQPQLVMKSQLTSAGVPVKLKWAGRDTGSGVASYQLYQSTDGGSFGLAATTTSPVAQFNLPAGHSYRFRVNAVDRAGNTSASVLSRTFGVKLFQETSTSVRYGGAWVSQAVSGASGGKVKYAAAAGRTAKLTVTGTAFGWVTTLGPDRGKASVSFDGAAATSVDTHAFVQRAAKVIYIHTGPSRSHTVLVKNLATSGHPRIDVDAFVVLT